ncbi:MAG: PhnD/SsuA/transferrin family substrate-binding protein [Anaerolineales bacterium]|nr:PhnD/SsuA/transferrin family substrate-binding protein [Anaerolineales bacterium]
MNHKFSRSILFFTILSALACNLPRLNVTSPTSTPIPVTPTDATTPLASSPTVELGLAENPVILALPPGASAEQVSAANIIATQFTERTGYVVVTVIPDSQSALVDAFARGNAHIALFEPYAYLLSYRQGFAKAAFAFAQDGKTLYGAQFLARRGAGFIVHFNSVSETNIIDDATAALVQFNGKKPCWTDNISPSGYVIPLGYLNANGITTQPAAFVEGHPTVVRSLYAGGICDFGATYVDARKFPSLEDQFPDLFERVTVIWRIPEIIPYDVFAFSSKMPAPMRDLFASILPVILQIDQGRAALETAFGIKELIPVNDAYYDEFRRYVEASGLDLTALIK